VTLANRLEKIFPGFGQPQFNANQLREGVALTDGANTVTVPSSGSLTPTISAGKVRVKVYNGTGTSPALATLTVTVTDGTTTEAVFYYHPSSALALSSTAWADFLIDFQSELNCTSVSAVATLSGTSEGASMDIEVLGTI
jgi:hypothetical protein